MEGAPGPWPAVSSAGKRSIGPPVTGSKEAIRATPYDRPPVPRGGWSSAGTAWEDGRVDEASRRRARPRDGPRRPRGRRGGLRPGPRSSKRRSERRCDHLVRQLPRRRGPASRLDRGGSARGHPRQHRHLRARGRCSPAPPRGREHPPRARVLRVPPGSHHRRARVPAARPHLGLPRLGARRDSPPSTRRASPAPITATARRRAGEPTPLRPGTGSTARRRPAAPATVCPPPRSTRPWRAGSPRARAATPAPFTPTAPSTSPADFT